MHAAILRSPGQPPAYGEHPDPAPGLTPDPGRTLVRVTAAPIVPLDLLCATGTSYFGRPAVPYVPGVQGVGVVERPAVHPSGTRVWFATSAGMAPGDGSLGELCSVPDADVVAVPPSVTDVAAAALGLSAVAAWAALTRRAQLRAGERVLVLGAGGAVGQVAVAAAKLLGASSVVGLCRSQAAEARARAAGADEVVRSSGGVEELTAALRPVVGSAVDVVIDPLFGAPASAAASLLAEGGRLVNLGGSASDSAVFSSAGLRSRSAEVLGYTNNALSVAERNATLRTVLEHAGNGLLAVAHTTRPLSEVGEAWIEQEAGDSAARVVLTVP